jgi:hypothetical protein
MCIYLPNISVESNGMNMIHYRFQPRSMPEPPTPLSTQGHPQFLLKPLCFEPFAKVPRVSWELEPAKDYTKNIMGMTHDLGKRLA